MKLITTPDSPFGARIIIAARAKAVPIECVPPPAGMVRSPESRAINPIGKIPVLLTDRGDAIPESEVIVSYLEDRFPTPSLRPLDPDQRARVNVAIRMTDTYIMAPLIRLFPHLDPTRRDGRIFEHEMTRWKEGLAALAHFVRSPLPEAEAGVSLADCFLPPSLHLSARIAKELGLKDDLLEPHEALLKYYSRMKDHPIVGHVLDDLKAAQAV